MLLWNFAGFYVFQKLLTMDKLASTVPVSKYITLWFLTVSSITTFPFFGWLADVYFGRYRVIKCSLIGMWLISLLFCLSHVIIDFLHGRGDIQSGDLVLDIISIAVYISLNLALSSFLANSIQFGIDQLLDAPSHEITSLVRLYGWIWYLTNYLVKISHNCFYYHYGDVDKLIIPCILTVILCSDFLFSGWLVHEPVSKNPLRLIYRVLKFAWQNKYPKNRSAFSQWNSSKPFSRLDLAKVTFGGPFSTCQVEDVKIFWQIVLIFLTASMYGSLVIYIDQTSQELSLHLKRDSSSIFGDTISECLSIASVDGSGSIFIIICIPLVEATICSCLKRFPRIPLLKKALIGMLVVSLGVITYGILETVAHYINVNQEYINTTCVLDLDVSNSNRSTQLSLSYVWIAVPNSVYGLGEYILLVVALEFLCAQSPSSMKGLLIGLLFGIVGLTSIINIAWLQLVKYASKKWSSGSNVGCGTFYIFIIAGVLLGATLCYCIVSKFYKKRERVEDQDSYSSY